MKDLENRFWTKVIRNNSNQCWIWRGQVNPKTGYGSFRINNPRTKIGAHRLAFILANRCKLTKTDFICHKCDNKLCVNPDHLIKGNANYNMQDMIKKGRQFHPPRLKGFKSEACKVSIHKAKKINSMWLSGKYTKTQLAKIFKLGNTTITRITNKMGMYANI